MAFPYVFESNFEGGVGTEWDTETDNDTVLDYPHYTELARFPWSNCSPYRGAYCMRVALAGGTNDATLTEGDIDISAGAQSFFRFWVYFAGNFTGSANDTFHLFELQQGGGTVELTVGGRIVAATNAINLGIGETAPTVWASDTIQRNKWYCIEVAATCDSGVGNDGSGILYINGASAATVSTLDQGAIGQGVLGVQNQLATTTGTILFDCFAQDDTRLGYVGTVNPTQVNLTKTGHIFVGPGSLAEVDLICGNGTNNVITLYDTDVAESDSDTPMVLRLNNTVAYEYVPSGPLEYRRFEKGCYAVMSGTNPRANVTVCRAPTLLSRNVLREYARGN